MNFNEIKQGLKKKIAGMSIDDFDEFIEQMYDMYNATHNGGIYVHHQFRDCNGRRAKIDDPDVPYHTDSYVICKRDD